MAGNGPQGNLGKEDFIQIVASAVAPLVQKNSEVTGELLRSMNEIKLAQELTNERLSRVINMAEAHEHILRGNGKIGLVTRIEQIENRNRFLDDTLREINDAIRGTEDKPGLIGRVKHLEDKAEGLAKPMWIILTALLSTGVTLIISNLLK